MSRQVERPVETPALRVGASCPRLQFPFARKAPNEQSGDENEQLVLKNAPCGSLRGHQACEEAPRRLETDQFAKKEGKFTPGGAARLPPKTCRLIGCRQLNGFSFAGCDKAAAPPERNPSAKVQLQPRVSGGREEVRGDGWME